MVPVSADLKPHVEIRDLCIRSRGRNVIRDFSWSHERGAIAWVVGENGAGKSSLVRALAGRAGRAAQGGEIRLVPPTTLYYHPKMSVPHARVREWHRLFADVQAHGAVPAADALRPRVDPAALTTQLSTGETKRLVLSELLAQRGAILLLDEPYEHLSPAGKARLSEVLQSRSLESLLVVATNQDVPERDPVVLHVDSDATIHVATRTGIAGSCSERHSSPVTAPSATAPTTPIALRTSSLLRFDLLRLLRGRLVLAATVFMTLLVAGHVPFWRGGMPRNDDMFPLGFLLMLLFAWRLGIGADRRVAWDEYVVLNHTTAARYMGARLGAGLLTLLLLCAIAFAIAALVSGGDLRFASWNTLLWMLVALLTFPVLLAIELLADITYSFAVVALLFLAFFATMARLDHIEATFAVLGLDFNRYAWRELDHLITVVVIFVPILTVALAAVWRRGLLRSWNFGRRTARKPAHA